MSIYPEILKRVIANKLNITFSAENTIIQHGIFVSPIIMSPEFHDWTKIYRALQYVEYSDSIVYILVWLSLQKMKNTNINNHDVKTRCITKFKIVDETFFSAYSNDTTRQKILSILQKAQRTYHAFSRLSRVYRHKRTPVQINTDLYMNELNSSKPTTFVLLDHDKIYYFSLNDLAKIVLDSLTYSYLFFSEPKVCKNPYNNMPFTKSTLYNMYFQMKSTFCVVPRLIQLFFEADFNVFLFKKQNESTLLEHIIREYVAKTEPIHMRVDILKMVHEYDTQDILTIHPLFPSKYLLNGLKPMYILYLLRKHTQDGNIYQNYGHELTYRMNRFIKENPKFGRMIFKSLPFCSIGSKPVFNVLPTNTSLSGNAFVFGETTPPSSTNTTEFSFSNPTTNRHPSLHFSQTQHSRIVLHHTNTESNPGYNDKVVYKRSPVILSDFLNNHQYSEPAYNRYLYLGNTSSNDEQQPLASFVPDDASGHSSHTEPGQDQEDGSSDEPGVRTQRSRLGNVLLETMNATPLPLLRIPDRRIDNNTLTNTLTVYYEYTTINDNNDNDNNDNDNNDNDTVSTEEERIERIVRELEYVIADDNSSDVLSVASSINPDDVYDDDSVS